MKIEFDRRQLDKAIEAIDGFAGKKQARKLLNAFNRAGFDTRKAIMADIPKVFNNPNEFTKNSLYFNQFRLDQDNQLKEGFIGFKKKQKGRGVGAGIYLMPQEVGGSRALNGFERRLQRMGFLPEGMNAVPTKNLPRSARNPATLQKLATDLGKQVTSQVERGRGKSKAKFNQFFVIRPQDKLSLGPGVYTRNGTKPVRLFAFVDQVKYKAIFEFYKRAEKYFIDIFNTKLKDEMNKP